MIALVDMDGVLCDLEGAFWDSWTGTIVPDAERTEFYLVDQLPVDERADAYRMLQQPGFFRSLAPIPGSLPGIQELAEDHEVWICTSPMPGSSYVLAEKQAWVEAELGRQWVPRMIIAADKTAIQGDVLIDDKPLITGAHSPTWKHLLYTQPWNRGSYGTHGLVVNGWGHVNRMLRSSYMRGVA